jgi:predicted transcriptional regulator
VHRRAIEGDRATEPTVADLAKDDVVTCGLGEPVEAVARRVENSPYPFALVLGASRVVLGRASASHLKTDQERRVEDVMDPGPSTVRPHKTAQGVAEDLAKRNLRWAIVTTPDGEFIGVAARSELEAAVS